MFSPSTPNGIVPPTVYAAFAAQADRTPDAIAVVCEDSRLSYRELSHAAGRLAIRLQASGVRPGAIVGMLSNRDPSLIVSMLAILQAGAAYLPLDPADPEPRRAQIVRDAAPAVILTTRRDRDRVATLCATLCVDDDETAVAARVDAWHATAPDDLAYVIYTSGTTGTPKGVRVPHRAIATLVLGADYVTLDESSVVLQLAPASFDAATFEIWGPLLTGGRMVIVPTAHPSLDGLAQLLGRESVTTMFLTTALFRQVVDEHPDALRGVRELLTGGELVSAPHFRKILDRFPELAVIHVYGPTECTTFASGYRCTHATAIGETVPIGRGIAGRTMHVLADGEPVAEGSEGEIWIGGAGVALGYANRPEATNHAFVPGPDGTRYRTGDRGRLLADGVVQFIGRTDRQVKIRGNRVELGEVEAALRTHPAVRDAIATVETAANGTKDLVAHVLSDPVEGWRRLYEDVIYQSPIATPEIDPTLHIVGWNSSYTGAPLAADEMREQVEAAVARIRTRRPRRVLEIGYGTGMLLFRIAPECERYVGTDFSRTAHEFVAQHLPRFVPEGRVRLLEHRADELPTDERFDAVILHSVVQHFPDVEYLRSVLAAAIALVDDGGFVYVGDVRSLPLLRMFHLSVELGRVSDAMSARDFSDLVDRRVREERHLVLDPAFFETGFPRVTEVEIQLKRGRFHNELTRFRYDAILEIGRAPQPPSASGIELDRPPLGSIDTWLPELLRGRRVTIRHVANARTTREVAAMTWLPESPTVGALRERLATSPHDAAIDPDDLWRAANAHGYDAAIEWNRDAADGAYTVSFTPHGESAPRSSHRTEQRPLANQPHRPFDAEFVAALRQHLRERLPPYMMPAHIGCLDRWPLTSNGKIDTSKLTRPPRADRPARAPLPAQLRPLAELWTEILGVEVVDPSDHFFDLGGDSLKAIQLAHRASRKLGLTVSPVSVFEAPTLGALAAALAGPSKPLTSAEAARARGAARRDRGR